jgi:hypothetical protein
MSTGLPLIFDGHNDTLNDQIPGKTPMTVEEFFTRNEFGHIDHTSSGYGHGHGHGACVA